MKRAALYARVSTADQTTVNQLLDLRQMVQQRGYEVVEEYIDQGISGAKARRPALDKMMADARRGQFDVVVVWDARRCALLRETKHVCPDRSPPKTLSLTMTMIFLVMGHTGMVTVPPAIHHT